MNSRHDEAILGHVRTSSGRGPSWVDGRSVAGAVPLPARRGGLRGLVRRHGPMVLGVCRRVLATRTTPRTPSRPPSSSWSARRRSIRAGTAGQLALRGRPPVACGPGPGRPTSHARAAGAEAAAGSTPTRTGATCGAARRGDRPAAGELPRPGRALRPGGQTHEEAARQLGCPEGTVGGRLAQGRSVLAAADPAGPRPSGRALARRSRRRHRRPCRPRWSDSTIRAATRSRRARRRRGDLGQAAALAEGVLKTMFLTKLKMVAITLMGAGVVTAGATGLAFQAPGGEPRPSRPRGGRSRRAKSPTPAQGHPSRLRQGFHDGTSSRPDHRTMRMTSWSCSRCSSRRSGPKFAGRKLRSMSQRPSLLVIRVSFRETRIM